MSDFNPLVAVFTFSTYLYYNKSPKALSKTGEVSLYLRVYIGSKGSRETEDFPLKLKWPVNKIDLEASKLKSRKPKDEDVNDYNLIILSERAKHNEIAKRYRLHDTNLNMSSFKRDLKLFDYKKSLITYMDKRRKERLKTKDIEWQTYKNHGSTIKAIMEYEEFVRFDQLNKNWMNAFKNHLIGKALAPGTVWTRIRDLKGYLALANEEKIVHVDESAVNFSNPEPATVTTYLNREEIKRLMNLLNPDKVTDTEYVVLRAFLFTCFTSLRISDVYKAGNKMLVSHSHLTFTAKKNQRRAPKRVNIPLIPIARALVDESLHTFFELPTEQEYNRTLKDLAAKANIKKRLTSHVGRHTFGYLYMTTVGNLYSLKEIMGHSKIETTERYAHLDDEYQMQQALKMQEGFEDVAQRPLLRVM